MICLFFFASRRRHTSCALVTGVQTCALPISLTHLLTVPVDIIKIDKSFVARLAPGDASMAIVEGLLQIARDLEIRVIAEGIETDYQAQQLSALGCHLGQGYLYSEAEIGRASCRERVCQYV